MADTDMTTDGIIRYDQHRLLFIRSTPVRFTPLEYGLMQQFVEHFGMPLSYAVLARTAFGRSSTAETRLALEKHIDRLRSKVRPLGLTLPCVTGYGYVLLWDDEHIGAAPQP